jgi:hypothetical protein
MRTVLEFERGSEPEYRRIFKGLAGEWRRWARGALTAFTRFSSRI